MKDHVAERNAFMASKRDCSKDKTELMLLIKKLNTELTQLKEDHQYSRERISTLEETVLEKAELTSVSEINDYLELLPTKEEVLELREHMRVSLDKFGK